MPDMFLLEQVQDPANPSRAASALISFEAAIGSASFFPKALDIRRLHSNDARNGSFDPQASLGFDKCKVVIIVKATTFCFACAAAQSSSVSATARMSGFNFLDQVDPPAKSASRNVLLAGRTRVRASAGRFSFS